MKRILLAVLLAAVIALGAIDVFIFAGQPSTPAATAGSADRTLAVQTLPALPSSHGCWVPGDLIGDANPATVRCASGSEP
jgi:hypothetical protein